MNESSDGEDGLLTVASGAGLVFSGRVTKLILGFATQLLMARLLGATSYGGIIIANMAFVIFQIFAAVGMQQGLETKVPYHEDDPQKGRGVVKSALHVGFLTSGGLGALMFLTAPWVALNVFDDPAVAPLLQISAVGLPFIILLRIAIGVAKGSRDAKPHVLVNQILRPITNAGFVTLLVIAGFGAIGAKAGSVLSIAVAAIAAAFLAHRSLPYSVRGPTVRMHRELLSFSFPLMFSAGASFIMGSADTVLIGVFLESSKVGIYNVAFQFRGMAELFYFPLAFLLPPVLTRFMKQDRWDEANQTYQIITKWMVLLTLPIFLLMVFFPEIIIGVTFGTQYLPGQHPLQLFALVVFINAILGPAGRALVALGYNKSNMYVFTLAGVLNVLLNILFIPRYGILGAAVATAFAQILRDLSFGIILYRVEGIYPLSWSMVKPLFGTLVVAGVGYAIFLRLFETTLLTVVGIGILFLLLYVPLVAVLGGFEPEDKRLLSMVEDRAGVEFPQLRRVLFRLQR